MFDRYLWIIILRMSGDQKSRKRKSDELPLGEIPESQRSRRSSPPRAWQGDSFNGYSSMDVDEPNKYHKLIKVSDMIAR